MVAEPTGVLRASPPVGAGSVCSGAGAELAFRFFVGVHQTRFLWHMNVPVMISRRTLQRSPPGQRARTVWALDSGGFTELSLHGAWTLSPGAYVRLAQRFISILGPPVFCAPQDWMCEPSMLRKTGLTVAEHQRRTVRNYLLLRTLAPDLPWMPVLQGWTLDDYRRCIDQYSACGVTLDACERVGIGTICRRQSTQEAAGIVRALAACGLRLHGFGIKRQGLALIAPFLASADSHAWSFGYKGVEGVGGNQQGRYRSRVPNCCGHYASCANCWRYAQRWHAGVLASLPQAPERYAYQLGFNWPEQRSVPGGARG